MLTQLISFDLTQAKLDDIRIVQGDTAREIQFVASDLNGELSTNDYTYSFNLIKPDNTFVISTLEGGVLQITEQMWPVVGTSFYNLQIKDNVTDLLVYSGQGAFIVDGSLISEEAIESVAEVNGYIFPDDFATKDGIIEIVEDIVEGEGFAKIDDAVTTSGNAWSAAKISDYADGVAASEAAAAASGLIDDQTESTTKTWSSEKITDAIEEATSGLSPSHDYSIIERVVGSWLNGEDVWEVTFPCAVNNGQIAYTFGQSPMRVISITGTFRFTDGMGYIDLPIGSNFTYVNTTYVAAASFEHYGNKQIRIFGSISGQNPQNMIGQNITVRYVKG